MPSAVAAVLAGAGVHLLAVMSPGPNFLVASRTAMAHSRRAAQWVTVGFTTGSFAIVLAGFLGASAVFTRSERLYETLRLAGAAYLVWLGLKALWSLWRSRGAEPREAGPVGATPTAAQAYRLGLLTIASNAKAFVYFVVFFTSIVPPDLPVAARATLVVVMPLITFTWYSFIAWAFSGNLVRGWYARLRIPVEALFGCLLLIIGIEVGLST